MARKDGIDRGICQRKGRKGWWVRLYVNGREKWERCDTKSQAKALYGRRKAEQREGRYFEKPKAVPFRDMALEYLKTVEARRKRKGDDQSRINRWLTAFGDQDASTITIRQIEKVLTDLQDEGMQPATLVRHLTLLKAAFNRAKRLGLVKENPACLVKPPKVNNVLVRYLTPDQEATLLSHLPEKYRPIVLLAVNTGLRQGELLRLTWADIDWNVGVLTIHETKTGERRRVPMNSIVVGLLSSLKTSSQSNPTERVFPFDARYVRRIFEEAVTAAGLAPFRFHDCRHTFASRLAMQGANDRTLMALGGWKSPAMLSRYAHLSPAHLWKAVEGLTEAGTVTKTVTEETVTDEEVQKLLKKVVSRLGLEPRALALKGRCSTV
jgi:integrase